MVLHHGENENRAREIHRLLQTQIYSSIITDRKAKQFTQNKIQIVNAVVKVVLTNDLDLNRAKTLGDSVVELRKGTRTAVVPKSRVILAVFRGGP